MRDAASSFLSLCQGYDSSCLINFILKRYAFCSPNQLTLDYYNHRHDKFNQPTNQPNNLVKVEYSCIGGRIWLLKKENTTIKKKETCSGFLKI